MDTESAAITVTPVNNDTYFHSYEDLEVHALMLADKPRNEAYRSAIFNNRKYFEGKTVLDVGAGTGILSMFCAQAGAAKVYAVEASNIAEIASVTVKENKYEDVIQVIHSRLEEAVLPGDEKVDVIISEWMGFYLLHEGMLDSVIIARDKFLKPDGLIFPETATLYAAPCSLPDLYDFWTNIHGVSMNNVGKCYRGLQSQKPDIRTVPAADLLAEKVAVCWIDLRDTTVEEITEFSLSHVASCQRVGKCQGFVLWFDCEFPDAVNLNENVILSTSSSAAPTHWKQTTIVLPQEYEVEQGTPIAFQFKLSRSSDNARSYNILLEMLDPEETDHPIPCDCYYTKCIVSKAFLDDHPEYETSGLEECTTTV